MPIVLAKNGSPKTSNSASYIATPKSQYNQNNNGSSNSAIENLLKQIRG